MEIVLKHANVFRNFFVLDKLLSNIYLDGKINRLSDTSKCDLSDTHSLNFGIIFQKKVARSKFMTTRRDSFIRGEIGLTLDQFYLRLNEFLYMVNNPEKRIDRIWSDLKGKQINEMCAKFKKLHNFQPIKNAIALSPFRAEFQDILDVENYTELLNNQEDFDALPELHPQKLAHNKNLSTPKQYEMTFF